MGVWIETVIQTNICYRYQSLPMWECGLKRKKWDTKRQNRLSLPMWECGLKHRKSDTKRQNRLVTPHVGVWIETRDL